MNPPLRVVDGSKFASFDGQILEVSGLNGSAETKQLTLQNIVNVAIAAAGDEWMFGVQSRNGGFSLVISPERKSEWEALVQTINSLKA
jgi:hypothetical protein